MLVHQLFRTAIQKWPTCQSQHVAWQLTSTVFCYDALHSCTQIKRMPRFTFNGCQQYQLCAVRHASNFCHNCKDDKAVPFRYEHTTGKLAISARHRTTVASGCATSEGHTSIPPTRRSNGHVVRRLAGALSGETSPRAYEQVTGEAYRNPLLPRPSLITEAAMEKWEHVGATRQQRIITSAIAHWPLRSVVQQKWGSICSAASKTRCPRQKQISSVCQCWQTPSGATPSH